VILLVDVNVLLYAYNTGASQHQAAQKWLEDTICGPHQFGLCWHTIMGFIRIGTDHRALARPFSLEEVSRVVDEWLQQESVTILVPGARHWSILTEFLIQGQARGPLAMDAHLAALSVEHGATFCTTDRDFSRFSGLKTLNPLETN
jgi:toxin-antitoxin system PIN domain toxin